MANAPLPPHTCVIFCPTGCSEQVSYDGRATVGPRGLGHRAVRLPSGRLLGVWLHRTHSRLHTSGMRHTISSNAYTSLHHGGVHVLLSWRAKHVLTLPLPLASVAYPAVVPGDADLYHGSAHARVNLANPDAAPYAWQCCPGTQACAENMLPLMPCSRVRGRWPTPQGC